MLAGLRDLRKFKYFPDYLANFHLRYSWIGIMVLYTFHYTGLQACSQGERRGGVDLAVLKVHFSLLFPFLRYLQSFLNTFPDFSLISMQILSKFPDILKSK